MPRTVIFLTATGAGSWTVPSDWNSANNFIDTIGGGASGGAQNVAAGSATGGGGGAWSRKNNLALAPGASINFSIGTGGAPASGISTNNGSPGGDTWFNGLTFGAASVGARGGSAGAAGTGSGAIAGGAGGAAASGIGDSTNSGGAGGTITTGEGSATGGGGAAGLNGNGNTGATVSAGNSSGNGGSGDAGFGGAANGGNGTEYNSSHGSGGGGSGSSNGGSAGAGQAGGSYGAGGGAGVGNATNTSGAGFQGLIVISYDALTAASWFMPFSEPVRQKRGLGTHLQDAFAAPAPNPIVPFAWYAPFSDPVRQRPGTHAARQQFFAGDKQVIPKSLMVSWFEALSEPVRHKPALPSALQPFLSYQPNPTTVTPFAWFAGLSEPVRLKQGLKAMLQQFLAAPSQLRPNPTTTGVLNAVEIKDTFLAGVSIWNQVETAEIGTIESKSLTAEIGAGITTVASARISIYVIIDGQFTS